MNKTLKIGLISLLAVAVVGGVTAPDSANATVTIDATSAVSDAALTLTGVAASVWSVASAADGDDLTISVTNGKDSSLILSSTGTGANALEITTTAGGLDISVTGGGAGSDLDISTGDTTTEIRITSASDQDDAVTVTSSAGGIDINAKEMLTLDVAAGTATTADIIITNTPGTDEAAIAIQAVAGGVDIDAAALKNVSIQGGQVLLVGVDDAASAISLTTNTGTSETIVITNSAGTDNAAVAITSTLGGIDINAKEMLTLDVAAGTAGTADIIITNTPGTDEAAIAIQAVAGGVDIDAAATKDVAITGGQIILLSSHNVASAISLTTGAGTSETIVITNTAGTAAGAVTIAATGGTTGTILINADGTGTDAVNVDVVGGLDIDTGEVVVITTTDDEIQLTAGTAAVVIAGDAIGTDALTLTNGDATLTSGDLDLTAGRVIMGTDTQTCSSGLIIDLSSKTKGVIATTGETNTACAISFTNGTAGEFVVLSHDYNGTGIVTFADVTGFDASFVPVAAYCTGIDAAKTAANDDHFYLSGVMTSATEIMILGCVYFDAAL